MSERKKKVIFNHKHTTLDSETGEILEQSSYHSNVIESEPVFIKFYLRDIMYLADMPTCGGITKARIAVLYSIVKRMEYNNMVAIPPGIRKVIADETGLNDNTVRQYIHDFVKARIFIKQSIGMYLCNPYYFGKGSWKDIHALRCKIMEEEKNVK